MGKELSDNSKTSVKDSVEQFSEHNFEDIFGNTVELGNKELFGCPRIVPWCQKFLIFMKQMANWSQEMVPFDTNLFLIKPFLIAKFDWIFKWGDQILILLISELFLDTINIFHVLLRMAMRGSSLHILLHTIYYILRRMDGSSLSISFADSLPAYAIESGPSEPGGTTKTRELSWSLQSIL